MPNSINMLARAYALELLSKLNDQPHIIKEKLFADAVAYYRWLLVDKKASESLVIYWSEFKAHHKTLVAAMEPDVRVGCFITWFVEQRFHTLPPLATVKCTDQHQAQALQCTRFSQPSFRLPTGNPAESYLMQWLYWHLDNLPTDDLESEDRRIFSWSCEMASEATFEDGKYLALLRDGARFFAWCRDNLRTWDTFIELFVTFLHSEVGLAIDQSNLPLADACFVNWFCQHVLDPIEQISAEPVASKEHDA